MDMNDDEARKLVEHLRLTMNVLDEEIDVIADCIESLLEKNKNQKQMIHEGIREYEEKNDMVIFLLDQKTIGVEVLKKIVGDEWKNLPLCLPPPIYVKEWCEEALKQIQGGE